MESIESIIFEDGEFQAGIARHTLAYLSSRQRKGYTTTGLYYTYHEADNPRGLVTIVHGFSEGMYKYREFIYILVKLGYSCLAYEHRGHGRSVRTTESSSSVHIDSFDTYVEDLEGITEELALKFAQGLPIHLFGHSMGGCVAALFCERHPSSYNRLILSSPMLSLKIKGLTKTFAKAFVHIKCASGKGEETFAAFHDGEKFASSTSTSRERWEYYRNVRHDNILLKTTNPTYSWIDAALPAMDEAVDNASQIKVPTLVFLAEDDRLVDNSAAEHFAGDRSNIALSPVKGTRHEIMHSPKAVLVQYYSIIDAFLSGRL